MQSEIARIRAKIEAECIALQHLSLFASVASHERIRAKYQQLDEYHTELKKVVGEEKATETIVTIYNETIQ